MKRWLLLSLLPIALLLLAVGALALQSSDEAGAVAGNTTACAALHTDLDSGALVSSVDGSSLSSNSDPLLAAKCYMVGISVFPGGCGSDDLYVLRYLCYEPGRGWYYVNYWYCQ
jgi:hypothetical protein